MRIYSNLLPLAGLGLLVLWLGTGCAEEKPTTYRIPKVHQEPASAANAPVAPATPATPSTAPAQQGMTVMPGMAEQSAAFDTPTWTAPANWQAQPLGQMRKGSWLVTDAGGTADISVLPLGGGGGGNLANINRWCGQIGLEAMTQGQLDTIMTQRPIKAANAAGYTVLLHGPRNQSILAAIIPVQGSTWFFKMMGPTDTVQAQTATFTAFVNSTRFPE